MDTRGRDANKRYRNQSFNSKIKYATISLTLDARLINFINEKIKEEDNNMSKFIEDHVSKTMDKIKDKKDFSINRRKYKTFPQKKTFTFTIGFAKKIKESGNMSVFVETILSKEFKLDLQ